MKKFSPLGDSIKRYVDHIPNLDHLPDQNPDVQCPIQNPDCDGYGNIIDERGARKCECVTREILRGSFGDARVPKRFLDVSLETYQPGSSRSLRMALNYARSYVDGYAKQEGKGVYISGPTGVGKTHLAVGILKGLMEQGYDGVFYNVVDLLDAIRNTYDPSLQSVPKNRIEEQLKRHVLILDDFGMQRTSSWVIDRLYKFINWRYQECKTLIITSNKSLDEIQRSQVEPALASRIMSLCHQLEVKGDDFRKKPFERYKGNRNRHE